MDGVNKSALLSSQADAVEMEVRAVRQVAVALFVHQTALSHEDSLTWDFLRRRAVVRRKNLKHFAARQALVAAKPLAAPRVTHMNSTDNRLGGVTVHVLACAAVGALSSRLKQPAHAKHLVWRLGIAALRGHVNNR